MIYIIGLIMLIIWKVTVGPPTFETQTIGGVGSNGYKQNTPPFFSQSPTQSRAEWLMYLVKVLEVDL